MSIDTAIDLIESLKKYMIGADGKIRVEQNALANAMADCAAGHLADEARSDPDLAKVFEAFLLDIERADPVPEDLQGDRARRVGG